MVGGRRIECAAIEIEATAFVTDFDDQARAIHFHVDVDALLRIVLIAPQNGVRQRFSQRDGDIQVELMETILQRLALLLYEADDTFDFPNVVGNLEVEGPDAGGSLGQKL